MNSIYEKALSKGASSVEEPANQEYGDRRAAFQDPCGNCWYIATCITGPD
ncbi:MAG: hypothetical protein JJU13_06280 [Balneolaceae bacterium]|nr:hypothetical protein [Balneolaceae bacterium]